MAANATSGEKQGIVKFYDDGLGWTESTVEKELAYRNGFLEEARKTIEVWPNRNLDLAQRHIHQRRVNLREEYSVYEKGDAGPKTYHLGYRPGHSVPAAELRSRNHGLSFIEQAQKEVADSTVFEEVILPAWLKAVEQWAGKQVCLNVVSPPPWPTEVKVEESNGV